MIKSVVCVVCVALAIAFYTLLERKVLGYIQQRKGPNKAGYAGLPQPLADAVKLFVKENVNVFLTYKIFYVLGPVVRLVVALAI